MAFAGTPTEHSGGRNQNKRPAVSPLGSARNSQRGNVAHGKQREGFGVNAMGSEDPEHNNQSESTFSDSLQGPKTDPIGLSGAPPSEFESPGSPGTYAPVQRFFYACKDSVTGIRSEADEYRTPEEESDCVGPKFWFDWGHENIKYDHSTHIFGLPVTAQQHLHLHQAQIREYIFSKWADPDFTTPTVDPSYRDTLYQKYMCELLGNKLGKRGMETGTGTRAKPLILAESVTPAQHHYLNQGIGTFEREDPFPFGSSSSVDNFHIPVRLPEAKEVYSIGECLYMGTPYKREPPTLLYHGIKWEKRCTVNRMGLKGVLGAQKSVLQGKGVWA